VFSDSIEKNQKQREAEAAVGEDALTEAPADETPVDEQASADDAVADESAPADDAVADEQASVDDVVADEPASADDAPADEQASVDDAPADEPAPAVDEESLFLDLPDDPVVTAEETQDDGTEASDGTDASDAADATDAAAATEAETIETPDAEIEPDPDAPATEQELLDAVPLELSAAEIAEIERKAKMQWFVIHANTGHENKVMRDIDMAIKSGHMEEYFGEVLVPTQEVTEMKNGKRSTVKRKFFPSYILVEMIMNKQSQHFINSIPGVTRFIGGTPLKPEPITKDEADRILGRISGPAEGKARLEIPYEIGDSVQVMDGPFTEWIGVINEINHDKGKLKVMISIFGSETPVELDFLQVKPI